MREYCEVFGEPAYKPGALRYGFRELIGREEAPNMPPDRLTDLLKIMPDGQERFLEMPALVKAIKLRQRPVVRFQEPATRAEIELSPEDAEEVRKNMARFKRFRQIAEAKGLDWWRELLVEALRFAKVEIIFLGLVKNGPNCFMNWTMCCPFLKSQPIWEELEQAASLPTPVKASEIRSNIRTFPNSSRIGNMAAYRAGN
jgi:hypothetical protein